MIDVLPEVLYKHHSPLSEVSKDKDVSLIDDDFEVVDFDKVKDDYRPSLNSNDGLYFTWKSYEGCRLYFIEFKNGYVNSTENKQLFDKIYDSVNILSDIVCRENFEVMQKNPIEYLKTSGCYILVYNSKNDPEGEHMTEETEKGLRRQGFFRGFAAYAGKLAKREPVYFGLDIFRGYLFRNVHTYTAEQFTEKFLERWKSYKTQKSSSPAT